MRRIEGGVFSMGAARFYPEERPVRKVEVTSFLIDATPVTNAQFARFVAATGHVTLAERPWTGPEGRQMPPGSAVFHPPRGPVNLADASSWWRHVEGACWRQPSGPGSDIAGLDGHPVVHVVWEDAAAYAAWAGKRLLTEPEWEFAARGGVEGADYAWGNQLAPDGAMLANYWQGEFPHQNLGLDGWERTSPVRSFPANDYGLFDMIGNVWEWTADCWDVGYVNAPADGSARIDGDCTQRVARGAGWSSNARNGRSSNRGNYQAGVPYESVGFRVVRELP